MCAQFAYSRACKKKKKKIELVAALINGFFFETVAEKMLRVERKKNL